MGKEHGVALNVERKSHALNTDQSSVQGNLGDALSWEEVQLKWDIRKGQQSLGAVLKQKYLRGMTDKSMQTMKTSSVLLFKSVPHQRSQMRRPGLESVWEESTDILSAVPWVAQRHESSVSVRKEEDTKWERDSGLRCSHWMLKSKGGCYLTLARSL